MAKDNTVAIGERVWQIEKTRLCSTLAGCTITVHEHLDGRVSLLYGPHVVGCFDSQGWPLTQSNNRSAVEKTEWSAAHHIQPTDYF